ncbi:MAG: hypothetical protein R3E08_05380 [Thiotrichaceae bacterium]
MKFTERQQKFIQEMYINLNLLQKSLENLDYSYQKCLQCIDQENYNLAELESLEALTARFARTSDIFINKVVKTLLILLQEMPKTVIDTAHFLEKLGIVNDAEQLLIIRELRNIIAHDYVVENPRNLFIQVMQMIAILKLMSEQVSNYFYSKFQTDS